jgi:predicted dehydrogenase
LIEDKDADAIFVLSCHDSHAQYAVAALANHKPVLVEKPLAISREQLEEVRRAYQAEKERDQAPFLMVGNNRRFAPFTEKLKEFFASRQEPMVAHIRVNAGYMSRGSLGAAEHRRRWQDRGRALPFCGLGAFRGGLWHGECRCQRAAGRGPL